MLLWGDPDMTVAPFAEITQLLYLWMVMLHIVLER